MIIAGNEGGCLFVSGCDGSTVLFIPPGCEATSLGIRTYEVERMRQQITHRRNGILTDGATRGVGIAVGVLLNGVGCVVRDTPFLSDASG